MPLSTSRFTEIESLLASRPFTGDPVHAECLMLAKIAGSTNAFVLRKAAEAANEATARAKASNSAAHLILTAYWAAL